jgi:hypothetical protein
MARSEHSVEEAVNAYLQGASPAARTVAPGEWGVVLDDVGGRPLEVGLRLADGLLRAQAWVAPAGVLDPHLLLHRNRLGVVARYAHSSAGEVHVHAELPAAAVSTSELDRMLGALVGAAETARAGWRSAPAPLVDDA